MRQIKASEVKPGMEVEVPLTRRMMVNKDTVWDDSSLRLSDGMGRVVRVDADTMVTVLSEPHSEEPRWVAARAKVGDYRFFRVDESDRPWRKADCEGRVFPYWYTWGEICSLGTVTVVPDQGWDGQPLEGS